MRIPSTAFTNGVGNACRWTINRRDLSGSNSWRVCSVAQTDFEIAVDNRARICVAVHLETSLFGNKGMRDQPAARGPGGTSRGCGAGKPGQHSQHDRHLLQRGRWHVHPGQANPPVASAARQNTLAVCSALHLRRRFTLRRNDAGRLKRFPAKKGVRLLRSKLP